MKFWVDEDLFPSLVDVARRRGLDATCNRDRALLGRFGTEVLRHCIDEDRTLITNNSGDFRRLCEREAVHPVSSSFRPLREKHNSSFSTSR
jgi:predicted nuclease of predicted toxin-antitoxin system